VHSRNVRRCPTLMTRNRHSAVPPFSSLRLSHWSDLRHSHRLGHAVENYNALAAAARRQRLGRYTIAAVNVLLVVCHPDVARRIDVDIDLHLWAATNVPAGWRNLIAGLEAGWAVLGASAA
jgi:hypothetical protein